MSALTPAPGAFPMYDLTDLFERRARLSGDALDASETFEAVYADYEDGKADFGDRCYYEDRAREASADLFAFDLGAAALMLALEA